MRARTIEALLIERIAEILYLAPEDIDPDAPHSSYGLDSATALILAAEIEEELGVHVDDSLAWDHPTIRALAEFLAERELMQAQAELAAVLAEEAGAPGGVR